MSIVLRISCSIFTTFKLIVLVILCSNISLASQLIDGNQVQTDSFIDLSHDYTKSFGRVTDFSLNKNIIKVWSEDKNLRFFHDGDLVRFKVLNRESLFCIAHIRSTEERYLTMRVDDWNSCWNENDYFKRGTRIIIRSKRLKERVYGASIHRQVILKRKAQFLKQLKKINNFLWRYNEENLKIVGQYDKKILEVQNAKVIAIEQLKNKKNDYVEVQDILKKRLNNLDAQIKFYKVDRRDLNDRWKKDLNTGLPITRRPYEYSRVKRMEKIQKIR